MRPVSRVVAMPGGGLGRLRGGLSRSVCRAVLAAACLSGVPGMNIGILRCNCQPGTLISRADFDIGVSMRTMCTQWGSSKEDGDAFEVAPPTIPCPGLCFLASPRQPHRSRGMDAARPTRWSPQTPAWTISNPSLLLLRPAVSELPHALIPMHERDRHERPEHWLAESRGLSVLPVWVQPGQGPRVSPCRHRAAHPRTGRGHAPLRGCDPSPARGRRVTRRWGAPVSRAA